MKPVVVSVDVPQEREEVFDFLDVLANHECFTDHMLLEWTCSGPRMGVGARARMRVKKPGRADWIDMTAITSERPSMTVEESLSAMGRRRTRGTYTLSTPPAGGTHIEFRLDYLEAPAVERLLAPLIRKQLKRQNAKAMLRLKGRLAEGAHMAGHDRRSSSSVAGPSPG